jgi:predicted DNA-binding protein
MKTAISVPDATYERVTRRARELGMSRSELFARAAEEYLDDLDRRSVTARIDDALERLGIDESSSVAAAAGRRRLASDAW